MTPKEKAKELVEKIHDELYFSLSDGYNSKDIFIKAKQCALIAVDEILEICPLQNDWYWQEVKSEIEKL